jgi:hypothetical protein
VGSRKLFIFSGAALLVVLLILLAKDDVRHSERPSTAVTRPTIRGTVGNSSGEAIVRAEVPGGGVGVEAQEEAGIDVTEGDAGGLHPLCTFSNS